MYPGLSVTARYHPLVLIDDVMDVQPEDRADVCDHKLPPLIVIIIIIIIIIIK